MILDVLLRFVQGMIDALFSLVPTWEMPSLTTYNFIPYAMLYNQIFPVKMAVTLLAAAVGVWLVFNVWDLVVFVYHQFWGSN